MPLDRLLAEALAWPLLDPGSFRAGALSARASSLARSFATRAAGLGRAAQGESALCKVFPDREARILPTLRACAQRTLEPWGRSLRLAPDREQPGAEILRWRWLSLALPPGLLLAGATPAHLRPDPWLPVLPSALRPEGPIAHLHLHLGAVYPFEVLWAHMAARLSPARVAEAGHAPDGFSAEEWPSWLVRALLARRALAERLLGTPRPTPLSAVHDLADEPRAMEELRRGTLDRRDARREAALLRLLLHQRSKLGAANSMEQVWASDPVSDGHPWPEGRLLQAGLQADWLDEGEERLFVQMLRIKVALFRWLVSDPTRPGLSTFVQTYARITPYEGELGAAGLDIAAFDPAMEPGAVEVRVAPGTPGKLLDWVAPRQPGGCAPAHRADLEWGYILHLIRWREPKDDAKAEHPGSHLRELSLRHMSAADSTSRTLSAWPQLLAVVRALDVAGDERRGPLWLVLPALWRLLHASRKIAHQHPSAQPLRLTLHAGEDYAHLLTGIRAVMEPFEWGLLGQGDRLGHALALGESPERWFEEHPDCLMPRLERLHDLIWALDMVARWDPSISGATLLRWETELDLHAEAIFGARITRRILTRLRCCLGDPAFLPSLNLGAIAHVAGPLKLDAPDQELVESLARHLLSSGHAGRASWEKIRVDALADQAATAELQRRVRHHVARALVCVELNPSSNLLIGDHRAPLDLPMFQLRPVVPRAEANAPVIPVTLNADDPICFSTTLSDELAYTWIGLVENAQIEPAYAYEWINDAARASWRFRFTLPASRALTATPPGVRGRQWWRPGRE